MGDIGNLIASLGFPIAACLGLGWFVVKQFESNNKEIREMRVEHQDEIAKVTEALNNNTIALTKLCEKFDNMVCHMKED